MASTYLTRNTWGTPTDAKKFTLSLWVKRGTLGARNTLVGSYDNSSTASLMFSFEANDTLYIALGGNSDYDLQTTQLFRDVSAWYHIVYAVDSTQATASNRQKLYINGSQVTSFNYINYTTLDSTTFLFNNSFRNNIGSQWQISGFLDGSMAHFHFIDGTAYDASAFGQFDANGIWTPNASPSVTYGTNGFFLDFADSTSMGNDVSGENNDFTVGGGDVTQTLDTPSNVFATMNILSKNVNSSVTLAEGSTQVNVSNNADNCTSSFMVSSGKWYWEGKYTVGSLAMVGIRPEGMNYNQSNIFNLTGTNQGYYYYANSGNQRPANTSYGATYAVNDIIGFALDLDSGTQTITFYKNGASQGAITIATSGLTWGFSYTSGGGSDTFQMNFGNGYFGTTEIVSPENDSAGLGKFAYAVPAGYYALNTKNLAEFG